MQGCLAVEKMTNQNVVVSDAKGVAISVTVSNQTLFSSSVPSHLGAPGACITISRKKLVRLENGGGGARIRAWVESMRASSPPRMKSYNTTASLSETQTQGEERTSWTVSIGYFFFFFLQNYNGGFAS